MATALSFRALSVSFRGSAACLVKAAPSSTISTLTPPRTCPLVWSWLSKPRRVFSRISIGSILAVERTAEKDALRTVR
jgi:hypothetical protein